MWVRRFIDRIRGHRHEVADTEQKRRVDGLFYRRSAYDSAGEFYRALVDDLTADRTIELGTLRAIVLHLSHGESAAVEGGVDGAGPDGDDVEARVALWSALAERSDAPLARACLGDALLAAEQLEPGLEQLSVAFDADPSLVMEFGGDVYDVASRVGGPSWLRYQLACLRAALVEQPDDDDDYIREIYSELLEKYAGDEPALERIRAVGKEIDAQVAAGRLPRAMVRRGASRSRGPGPGPR
jgi:hypothetical protein